MGVFLDKPKKEKESESGEGNGLRYAVCSMQGWRIEMEDAHCIKLQCSPDLKNLSYFAVFDGHAGDFVSKYSAEHLLGAILEVSQESAKPGVNGEKNDTDSAPPISNEPSESPEESSDSKCKDGVIMQDMDKFKERIMKGFLELDSKMREHPKFLSGEERSGSTAVAAFVSEEKIVFANCGDSRGLLASKDNIYATQDHKPYNEDEKNRIERAGGSVIISRVNGSLAVSRALGDYDYKGVSNLPPTEQLVSAEPEITIYDRSSDDEFLLLACDGVWDVMSNEEVTLYIRSRLLVHQDLLRVCEELLETCLAKGSRDNMSVVLVTFPAAPTLSDEAVESEAALDNRIRERVTEIVKKDGVKSLGSIVDELSQDNIEGLPPGGGIQSKIYLVEEVLDDLFPNRQKDDGSTLSSLPVPLSMIRQLADSSPASDAEADQMESTSVPDPASPQNK